LEIILVVEKPKQNEKKRKKIKKRKKQKTEKAGHVRDKVIIFSN